MTEEEQSMATNIMARLEGDKLILEIDLTQEHGPTGSGKSTKVASSDGNMAVPGREEIKMGINVYKPRSTK